MKFLCLSSDDVMTFAERQLPGDGTLTAVFTCPGCGREMALLTNPMETQLISSMGVEIGGRTVPEQPFQQTRAALDRPREDAFSASQPAPESGPAAPHEGQRGVSWSTDATERLGRVPTFVRGMVKRIYADYARERDISVITVEVMDRARRELGLEGM